MDGRKAEFVDFPCKKLGGIAHANVEYFYKKDRRTLAGFECKMAADCGISRSPSSGTVNYTVQCPLYTTLQDFELMRPKALVPN